MSLLDLLIVALILVVCHFVPAFAFWGVALTVTLALIVERVIRGERIP